ncbi:MAG: ATP phosphoribosyltransferase [Chloroflexota bacterium]|nr:ATP phosphoribosyltransferase [Chloroflexota bacterium]
MIKLALPTGDLRAPIAELLSSLGLRVEGYGEGSRQYRLAVSGNDDIRVRVFRERDIPMQVALGNYDLGVTSLSWVTEMNVRFPQPPLVPLTDLQIGRSAIFACISSLGQGPSPDLASVASLPIVRLASEYPNIAESFARAARLPRYRIQAVAGAAEAYPPEDADLAIVTAADEPAVRAHGVEPVLRLLDNSAWLIANAASLAAKDLAPVLSRIQQPGAPAVNGALHLPSPLTTAHPDVLEGPRPLRTPERRASLRLAVPDGHQQRHVHQALAKAGLSFDGYEEKTYVRRPASGIDGLEVKVIRPQDMPQLVALGEFDIAITGLDLLNEHLYAFPSSPAYTALDLQCSQFNLSAVVDGALPADNLAEAMAYWRSAGKQALMIAAEFPATADHYARSRHFWRYRVIAIAGASEGFVPEDADLLIEGTETGRTIAENNLKILDNIYRSTTCLIARRYAILEGRRREVYEHVFGKLKASLS